MKIVLTALGLLAAPLLYSQPGPARPEFEVAAIRVSADGPVKLANGGTFFPGPRIKWSGSTLILQNFSVKDLILEAYNVKDAMLFGANGQDTPKYQITAKTAAHTSEEQVRQMAQALLADRFKLQIHRETREFSSYALVVAKNGPRIAKAKERSTTTEPIAFRIGRGHIAQPLTMKALAELLATRLGRPVADMTSLKGEYDIDLAWTPQEGESEPFAGLPSKPHTDVNPAPAQDAPPIFTAIQEQLGLKLETRKKTPVEVLVVDRVERPSEN